MPILFEKQKFNHQYYNSLTQYTNINVKQYIIEETGEIFICEK